MRRIVPALAAFLAAAPRAQAQKVFLNPSDQVNNSVACGGNESQYAVDTANRAATKIRAAGFQTKVVAGLSRAVDAANAWPAASYVSVHTNAGGGHGTETWYYSGSSRGRSLAGDVQDGLLARYNVGNRGVQATTVFYVLRNTHMPAALTESVFHDCRRSHSLPGGSQTEACFLKSTGGRDVISSGIAAGACRFHGRTCPVSGCTPSAEVCDGRDNDCDRQVDEGLTRPACSKAKGVCAGKKKTCEGSRGWRDCTASEYGADYQATESRCDGKDNDCDGRVDESLTRPACSKTAGVCAGKKKTCEGSRGWRDCTASEYGGDYEAKETRCDGKDNDCDGRVDEGLTAPACSKSKGVCAGKTKTCAGAAGWKDCTAADFGPDYEAAETTCDGKDNDCDGVVDDVPEAPPCALDGGVCAGKRMRCGGASGFVACTAADYGPGYEATETLCDGRDNDCDGLTDEELAPPRCREQRGVCEGSVARCGGSAGWLDCTAQDFGRRYETGELQCDGRDNDCDGLTDEDACLPDAGPIAAYAGTESACDCTAAGPGALALVPFVLACRRPARRAGRQPCRRSSRWSAGSAVGHT